MSRETLSGYDWEHEIKEFYGSEYPGVGRSCPKCGASLDWNWRNATDLILHIEWHENLDRLFK